MAWWNQPEGSVTPTVTLRRLAAWMAERGHRYDLDLSEGVVHFSVAGFDYVLMVVDRRILAVRAHHRLAAALPGSAELSRVRSVAHGGLQRSAPSPPSTPRSTTRPGPVR